MSQATSPTLAARGQLRAHWLAALSALLALLATAAVVLVLAIDGGSPGIASSVNHRQQPALRSDGGPNESAVAAAISSRPGATARPDESAVAAAISPRAVRPPSGSGGPDESIVASSVSGR